ncbi:hypothetical protein CTAYLR_010248 [Chrysophaeum taylorii]|uniref:Uncharacterized protein n=1 Tax=Chrysophaeum taylorii TaxID=2483200 RepID=A0AAD7XRT5_9STRA|nr:hypothetical protein CTAYLR_010248 [Chrysophaeum taylorii]
MDAKIDGTPFSVLMQQAVKLKTHMHKVDRVQFDRWPKFYQNSAFVRDEQRVERGLAYGERLQCAFRYKNEADAKWRSKKWLEAGLNYEWALGLFKWATPTDPNWRNKAVDDADMREEEFLGDTDGEKETILVFRMTCYLNLARAYFKQREYTTARQACDWALGLRVTDKGLLLRARCLVEPASHGTTETEAAISDLEEAERLAGPALKEVRSSLAELRRLRSRDKKTEKAYHGLFDRGEVYDANETAKRRSPEPENKPERPSPDAELAAAERLLAQYERDDRADDARELRDGIQAAKQKLAETPPKLDFRNPTKEMREDALNRGIDLTDPAVLDLLDQLQLEKDDPEAAAKRRRIQARLDTLSMSDMLRELKTLNLDTDGCQTKDDLRAKLLAAYLDADETRDPPPPTKKHLPYVSSWKVTILVASVLFAYRVYTSKLIRPLLFGDPNIDRNFADDYSRRGAPEDPTLFEEYDDDDEWDL